MTTLLTPAAASTATSTADISANTKLLVTMEAESKTVAFAMAQMTSLTDQQMLLVKNSAEELVPVPLTGGVDAAGMLLGSNLSFIDNLVGMKGLPIALDRIPPQLIKPLAPSETSAFLKYQPLVAKENSQLLDSMKGLMMGEIWKAMPGLPSEVKNVGFDALKGIIYGDGVFARPYIKGADDAFVKYVSSGVPSKVLSYYASPLYQNQGQTYDVIRGFMPSDSAPYNSINLNNVLSAGAYQAFQNYMNEVVASGKAPPDLKNIYRDYAARIGPEAFASLASLHPGDFLQITDQMFEKAKARGKELSPIIPTSSTDIPSIMPEHFLKPTATSDFGPQGGAGYQPMVITVQPTQKDLERYQNFISASDKRLTENVTESRRLQKYDSFIQTAITAATKMRVEATAIQKTMVATSAIPQITQMCNDIDKHVFALNESRSKIKIELEKLKKERNAELKERNEFVSTFIMDFNRYGPALRQETINRALLSTIPTK